MKNQVPKIFREASGLCHDNPLENPAQKNLGGWKGKNVDHFDTHSSLLDLYFVGV